MSFAYLWEYRVEKHRVDAFRRVYGDHGEWMQLFQRGVGYLRTDLFQDVDEPTRFVTTDFWVSKEARDAFRARFRDELDDLDERCEALTVEERFIGDFEVVG